MKKSLIYLFILFSLVSCKGQVAENIKIDASKIKEIIITNKVEYNKHHFKEGSKIIKDKNQIEKFINTFTYTEKVKKAKGDIDVKNNNGFFDITFNEGEKEYYYSIIYTIYDGVILMDNSNGDMYKNDRLEGVVYPLFVE